MRTAGKLAVLFLCTGKSFYNTLQENPTFGKNRENPFVIQKIKKNKCSKNNLQNEWNCDMLITEKNKHMFDI